MDDYISITTICDYLFCPYSIYLENIYRSMDEETFHQAPQRNGKYSHEGVENRSISTRTYDVQSLTIHSDKLKLIGKIDLYNSRKKQLVEYKYHISSIHAGMKYQLWAEKICMEEMGYEVKELGLYDITASTYYQIEIPNEKELLQIRDILEEIRMFDPYNSIIKPVSAKCNCCIYSSLCTKNSL